MVVTDRPTSTIRQEPLAEEELPGDGDLPRRTRRTWRSTLIFPWRKPPGWRMAALGATLLYAVITAVVMAPATAHCGSVVMGASPGDATAGGVWLGWNLGHSANPFTATTPFLGAPGGSILWRPTYATALTWLLPLWAGSHAVGPVCAWNLDLGASMVLNGVAMFALAGWLTQRRFIALVAGYAYAFTPFHIVKLYGHIGYVDSWPIPLLILSCLMLAARPTWRRGVFVGAAIALCCYTDGYYILFAGVTVVVLGAAAMIKSAAQGRAALTSLARHSSIAALSATLMLVPLIVIAFTQHSEVSALATRTGTDVDRFSARPRDYLLPAYNHPVYGNLAAAHHPLHGGNLSETTLYLGLSLLALAGVAVIAAIVRRPSMARGLSPRFIVGSLAGLALAAAIISGPTTIGGHRTPSGYIFAHVSYWRDYARLYLVVSAAVVALAAIALGLLPRNRRGHLITALALVVIAFDLLAEPPWISWSYTRSVPIAYRYLQAHPGGSVAEFPVVPFGGGEAAGEAMLTYQVIDEHPRFNGAAEGTQHLLVEKATAGLGDPQTVPVLRRLGVKWVVVDAPDYYSPGPKLTSIPGLDFVLTDARGTRLYRVAAGPEARIAVAPADGFYAPEATNERVTTRWTNGPATVDFISFSDPIGEVEVSFTAASANVPRVLTITQGGRPAWTGSVPAGAAVPVALHLRSLEPLRLTTDVPAMAPGVVNGKRDDRLLGLDISDLSIR